MSVVRIRFLSPTGGALEDVTYPIDTVTVKQLRQGLTVGDPQSAWKCELVVDFDPPLLVPEAPA